MPCVDEVEIEEAARRLLTRVELGDHWESIGEMLC